MLDAFGAARDIRSKGPGDWVSATDTASERVVRAALLEGAPDLPVFGEEEGGERAEVGWLVDPLDGTANFLHQLPGGRGVDRPRGRHGAGGRRGARADARRHLLGDPRRRGVPRRRAALGVGAAASRRRSAPPGSRSGPSASGCPSTSRCSSGRCTTFEDLRRAGAASLDLAWTAAGVYDGYFEQGLGPWDVAAGALLVREAGGVVTDWQGDPDAWLRSGDIVAAPPTVHETLHTLL